MRLELRSGCRIQAQSFGLSDFKHVIQREGLGERTFRLLGLAGGSLLGSGSELAFSSERERTIHLLALGMVTRCVRCCQSLLMFMDKSELFNGAESTHLHCPGGNHHQS